MSSVLRSPTVHTSPRPLGGREALLTDPAVQALVAEAEARGRAEGIAAGRAESAAEAARTLRAHVDAIAHAVDDAVERLKTTLADEGERIIAMAVEAAELVLGHAQHDDGRALRERLSAAIARIDDTPLTVRVHPDDHARLLDDGVRYERVELVADPSLGLGEATIDGPWAHADLTFASLLTALEEAWR